MRKAILFFVLFGWVGNAAAQDPAMYSMDVRMYIYHDHDNDVDACGSYFKIRFENAGGATLFEWYSSLSIGDHSGKEFLRTFYFSKDNPVRYIKILSDRYYENAVGNCKHGSGGGETTIDVLASEDYPCGSVAAGGVFSGYHISSTFEATIRPLSNTWTIQTEATAVMNYGGSLAMFAELEYSDGSTETVLSSGYGDYSNGSRIVSRNLLVKSNKSKVVRRVNTRAGKNVFSIVERSYDVTDPGIGNDLVITLDNPYQLGYGSKVVIRYVRPKTGIITAATSLPSNNSILLTINENLSNAAVNSGFQWQYSVDTGGFTNLPASFGNGPSITVSGEALFSGLGLDWKNYVFKTINFRALYRCVAGPETAFVPLVHVPSAPGILSATATPETCPGSNDGKVTIKFDRPLYQFNVNGAPASELLYVFLNGTLNQFEVSAFENDNTVTIGNRRPGSYKPTLLTTFPGLPNGYSSGDNHTEDPVTVAPRLPITFSAAAEDVHCHGGQDGVILVSAQGGTETYTSYVVSANDTIDQISLSQASGNSFLHLKSGSYTVKLKDGNQCDPKDGTGQPKTIPINVAEPSQPVFVSGVEAVEPRGFGLTDGHITVRGQYGTLPYTIDWRNAADNSSLTPEAPVSEGESVKSTLGGLGKGKYAVRFQDSNFDQVIYTTDVNIRGCFDTLTIFLTEPPLLEVELKEREYVSCYSYSDGEILARAKGGRPNLPGESYHPYRYEWFVLNAGSPIPFGLSDSIVVDRHSAWYRVKVTDRNGIEAWSPDFHLVQPDLLKVGFNTSVLLCNGDTNGNSQAIVTGGTSPYRYAWSTDETTSSINNLAEGWYSLVVTDQRGCTTFEQTEVQVPEGLELSAEMINPTCFGYSDGSITVSTTGGKAPYTYKWDHTEDPGAVAADLSKGTYTVKVEDDNHCFVEQTYTLDEPALLPVAVGEDKVLCKDQVLNINAAVADPQAEYLWLKDGSVFGSSASATLVEAGTYVLRVRDSKGCTNEEELRISRVETLIAADFAVATRVPRGERVRVANISNPAPEQMEWIVPGGVTIHERNSEYLEVTFDNFGEYVLGLRSVQGQCERIEYKTVKSVSRSELPDYRTPDEPYIKQFTVTPNPTDGNFTATVELKESTSFKLIFHSGQGTVIAEKEVQSQSFSMVTFELASSVSDGIYMLQLLTPHGTSVFKVLIKK